MSVISDNSLLLRPMPFRRLNSDDPFASQTAASPLMHDTSQPRTGDHESSDVETAKVTRRSTFSTAPWRAFLHQQSLFLHLTVIASVMITINILEAVLIDNIGATGHMIIFFLVLPACIIVAILAIIAWRTKVMWTEILEVWHKAEPSKKLSWIGVILTVIVPIIVCQFIYMPLVARREWRHTIWTSEQDIPIDVMYPGIAVVLGVKSGLNILGAKCDWESNLSAPCSMDTSQSDATADRVILFDPSSAASTPPEDAGRLRLKFDMTYNSTINPQSGMSFFLYDSTLTFNIDELHQACGNPVYYYLFSPPVTRTTIVNLQSTAHIWDDVVQSPSRVVQTTTQSQCPPQRKKYAYYTSVADTAYLDLPLTDSRCDVGGSNYHGNNCTFTLYTVQSPVVTTQKSAHGTDALKILTDEGGILGGILFVTWFFGIFDLYDVRRSEV